MFFALDKTLQKSLLRRGNTKKKTKAREQAKGRALFHRVVFI